eukprot:TRINITY_DN3875_c0_g1_i1.p1 TRINITY_DN3875_c0_g1~~TRINITY_DN3875_c0_g1_i1.p1  ORF type:complete len:478 (-),score=98.85 TRINITY_DN3875_c0_g1_i1:203-1474(-)
MAKSNILFDIKQNNKKVNLKSPSFQTEIFKKGEDSTISGFIKEDGSAFGLSTGLESKALMKLTKQQLSKSNQNLAKFSLCTFLLVVLSTLCVKITSVGITCVVFRQSGELIRSKASKKTLGSAHAKEQKIRVTPGDIVIACTGNFFDIVDEDSLKRTLSGNEHISKRLKKLVDEVKLVFGQADFILFASTVSTECAITNVHTLQSLGNSSLTASRISHTPSKKSASTSSSGSSILSSPVSFNTDNDSLRSSVYSSDENPSSLDRSTSTNSPNTPSSNSSLLFDAERSNPTLTPHTQPNESENEDGFTSATSVNNDSVSSFSHTITQNTPINTLDEQPQSQSAPRDITSFLAKFKEDEEGDEMFDTRAHSNLFPLSPATLQRQAQDLAREVRRQGMAIHPHYMAFLGPISIQLEADKDDVLVPL